MLRNTDTDGTLAEFEKFRTEYWIYVLDKLSVIKTKYKQMKRNISRWYPAFFLWVTVPFSISALQKVFPAQEQINKTQKKNETRQKDIETKTTPLQCTRNEFNTIRKSLAYLPFSAFKIVFAFFLLFRFARHLSLFSQNFAIFLKLFQFFTVTWNIMEYYWIFSVQLQIVYLNFWCPFTCISYAESYFSVYFVEIQFIHQLWCGIFAIFI